jgi:hypothetical protein
MKRYRCRREGRSRSSFSPSAGRASLLGAVADESVTSGESGAGQEGVYLPHEVVHLDVLVEGGGGGKWAYPLPADGAVHDVPFLCRPLEDAEVTERVAARSDRRLHKHLNSI